MAAALKSGKVKHIVLISSIGTDQLLNPLNLFGGVLVFGFIGLFLGPTLLALGQVLIHEWLAHPDYEGPSI